MVRRQLVCQLGATRKDSNRQDKVINSTLQKFWNWVRQRE